MAPKIHLGKGLDFDAHAMATSIWAALGSRGSGKTNICGVIAEGLLDAGIPVVVIDSVGPWFSLRLDRDGKTASRFDIPVLGGLHGDIPLLPQSGRQVAEALASTNSSAVLDISMMGKGERIRFGADFAEAFFEAKKRSPGPVSVIVEEAQRLIPQVMRFPDPNVARCLGAFEEMGEVGRNFGIGLGLPSLRPQKVNKDVLNLAETVLGFRMLGALERKAIAEWVQEKGAPGRDQVGGELPSLERGTAIVWSPGLFGIYGKFPLKLKSTYDASATPDKAKASVKVKALDLKVLQGQMAKVVEEARANDPKALKAEVARLQAEVAKKVSSAPPKVVVQQKPIPAEMVTGATTVKALLSKIQADVKEAAAGIDDMCRRLMKLAASNPAIAEPPRETFTQTVARMAGNPRPVVSHWGRDKTAGSSDLGKCARAILNVLAHRGQAVDSELSVLSGYRKTSSGYANALSELRTKGLIDGSPVREILDAGREAGGTLKPLPRGADLLGYWRGKLTKAEAAILQCVYGHGATDRQKISEETGYSITSSGFANALSGLKTLDLIKTERGGDVTIADVFRE